MLSILFSALLALCFRRHSISTSFFDNDSSGLPSSPPAVFFFPRNPSLSHNSADFFQSSSSFVTWGTVLVVVAPSFLCKHGFVCLLLFLCFSFPPFFLMKPSIRWPVFALFHQRGHSLSSTGRELDPGGAKCASPVPHAIPAGATFFSHRRGFALLFSPRPKESFPILLEGDASPRPPFSQRGLSHPWRFT